jgi:uncharacterized protein
MEFANMENKLESFILITTKKGNRYIFDREKKKTLLSHPLIYYFLKLERDGRDIDGWIKNQEVDPVEIENYGCFFKKDIQYYYKKYLFLKSSHFFKPVENRNSLGARLTAESIQWQLANIKQITLEITDLCNLKCEYCGFGKFYSGYDKRENKNLDSGVVKNLLTYLQTFWNSPINTSHHRNIYISFYGGEPLLNMPFIKEIVSFIKDMKTSHNRFIFSMTTNALLMKKHMDFLVKNDFRLLISLDGNEKNNCYRVLPNGGAAYTQIMENIRALHTSYPVFFKTNVNFNAVFHNQNSVSEIYDHFKKEFNKIPRISELNIQGIKDDKKEEFWNTYTNVSQDLYRSENYSFLEKEMFIKLPNIQGLGFFLDQYSGFTFRSYNELMWPEQKSERVPTGTCTPFSKKIFLTVNGKIFPCERVGHQFALGRVDEKTVDLNCEEIAQKYNRYYDKLSKMCSSCYNQEGCTRCLFHMDIEDQKIRCNGFMNYDSFSNYVSSFLSYLEDKPETYSRWMKEVIVA